jgi:hypothetical protein
MAVSALVRVSEDKLTRQEFFCQIKCAAPELTQCSANSAAEYRRELHLVGFA